MPLRRPGRASGVQQALTGQRRADHEHQRGQVDEPEVAEGVEVPGVVGGQRDVYVAPAVGLAPGHPERRAYAFEQQYDTDEGWAKYNSHFWSRSYREFLEFFFAKGFSQPHSTKQIEDAVGWGLGTDPETLANTTRAISLCRLERFRDTCARVRCPTLVIHGDGDLIRPHAQGQRSRRPRAGRS